MRTLLFAPIVAVLLSGCSSLGPSWNLARSTPTDVVPTYAEYLFATSKPINDPDHAQFLFTVERDANQQKPVLRFTSDGFRWDTIQINRGAFFREWGQIGGTNCPTDSYAISGHFTAPDRAEGTIKLASDCRGIATATFVATVAVPIIYPG